MKQNPLSADLRHILDHTRDLWEDLRGARLFITGGTGFFGCWLLESFLFANQELDLKASATVLTRRPDSVKQALPHLMLDPAIALCEGDVRNFEFPKGEYSYIIHAATDVRAKKSIKNPLLLLDTIIEGTRHTLDFSIRSKAEKFLLASSGAVYGKQPGNITHIPEDCLSAPDSLDPHSTYGIGKRTAEQLCALYAKQYGIFPTIARCFAFVGPYLPLDAYFAIGNFIRNGLNGDPINIQGDGTPLRSYLYGADLAIWLWTIFLRGSALRPYNVGSEIAISIANLAKVVAKLSKTEPEIFIKHPFSANVPVEQYVPSTQAARDELGLLQWTDLETSIAKTNQWYLGTGHF
jgi:nucleoside-diphosphate-sugar epimerase